MAEEKKPNEGKEQETNQALVPPKMTILNDGAIDKVPEESFDLISKLGPVFDILRHHQTQTPMAIAIYGDWGAGKTSAMRWLEDMLKEWNTKGPKSDKKITVRTVRFDPWKYHDKEDVWRGLIAEVIIETLKYLDVRNLSKDNVLHKVSLAAKKFGGSLGKGFLPALSGLKAKFPCGIVEYNFESIRQIYDEIQKVIHPEMAFLNKFESTLGDWLKDTLGKNERMVIFIDDLDRCMPDVALEVLEALKLYLSIEKIIFVIGVNREIVNDIVKKHYQNLGVRAEKADNYLGKMFQVEINITPSQKQVESYFDGQIKALNDWSANKYWDELNKNHRDILEKILRAWSRHNPREVKRLLNTAFLYGASAARMDKSKFAQGVQVFLIMKTLESYEAESGNWIGRKEGQEFFDDWSKIVLQYPDVEPPTSFGPESELDEEKAGREGLGLMDDQRRKHPTGRVEFDASKVAKPYRSFCSKLVQLRMEKSLKLLGDPELKVLMKIEFDTTVASRVPPLSSSEKKEKFIEMPREIAIAAANQLGKSPDELTEEDCRNIEILDLSSARSIKDFKPLLNFTNLQNLNLSGTQVSDISPLQDLTKLQTLYLWNTQVSDISPLKGLTNLQNLNLSGTQVSDVSPLKSLTNLQDLNLRGTQVSDVSPLKSLTNLQLLYLTDTQVSDISPLQDLTKLQTLYLWNTQVSDISPLKSLTNLQTLHLWNTQVSDISPLKGLTNLQLLYLGNTRVSDISYLRGHTNLQFLDLTNTQVSDISSLKGLINLQILSLGGTQVSDISPLQGLTNLQQLHLRTTQVSNISPLKGLANLEKLTLGGTQIRDISPLQGLTSLQTLDLVGTQISDISPLKGLINLQYLSLKISTEQIRELQEAIPKITIGGCKD